MGRIEDALKRAGAADARLSVAEPIHSRGRFGVTVDAYPREAEGLPDEAFSAPESAGVLPDPIAAPRAGASVQPGEFVQGKLVIDSDTPPRSVEQYRRLGATLHEARLHRPLRTILVSSAAPREGKTLTATNLALTLSESYKARVLLVDGDLRRPSIHEEFRIPNAAGLSDGLRTATGPLPLFQVSPLLTVLPAGAPDADPAAALTSDRMRTIVAEATERFDWVILDSPPVALVSDAKLMANLVDGVLLVIGAGATDYELVEHAISELGHDRIIGVVLNRVADDAMAPSSYYSYYQPDTPERA